MLSSKIKQMTVLLFCLLGRIMLFSTGLPRNPEECTILYCTILCCALSKYKTSKLVVTKARHCGTKTIDDGDFGVVVAKCIIQIKYCTWNSNNTKHFIIKPRVGNWNALGDWVWRSYLMLFADNFLSSLERL